MRGVLPRLKSSGGGRTRIRIRTDEVCTLRSIFTRQEFYFSQEMKPFQKLTYRFETKLALHLAFLKVEAAFPSKYYCTLVTSTYRLSSFCPREWNLESGKQGLCPCLCTDTCSIGYKMDVHSIKFRILVSVDLDLRE